MRKLRRIFMGALGVLSLALVVLGPLLAYTYVLPAMQGFVFFAIGAALGVVSTIAGAVAQAKHSSGTPVQLAFLGLPGLLALVFYVSDAYGKPRINDISTDLVRPPAFKRALTDPANEGRDMSFPALNRHLIETAHPDLQPLPVKRFVDDVFVSVQELAKSQPGWELSGSTIAANESVIEGTATSPVFHFVDDFVIRVTHSTGGGSVLDMRSKSRDGRADFGVNAERIKNFLVQVRD